MHKKVQFKVSFISAAVAMVMAGSGSAMAVPLAGNELVGPDVNTSGTAIVKIDQSGTGNITSKTGLTAGGAFIVDQSAGATTVLTIQQVGTSNTLGLSAFTNAATSVQVFQGADAADGNTGNLGAIATNEVIGNEAVIEIGKDSSDAGRAEASDVFLTQQGNGNFAGLHLGQAAGVFTGTFNLLQAGSDNTANVTINGQTTTGQTFNIGQSGSENSLTLVANGNQTTGMTFSLGSMNIEQTKSQPKVWYPSNFHNAATFNYASDVNNHPLSALFLDSLTGIRVLGTDKFKISAIGEYNDVQVDLLGAQAAGNRIDVNLNGMHNRFAVYAKGGAVVNLGGSRALSIENGGELVVYANGGTVSVNGVRFQGNGYLSTTDGGSITVSGDSAATGGMSILQSGAAHTFSSTNGFYASATWNVAQTGPLANSMTANNAGDSSFALTQTSETGGGAHALTLNDNGYNTVWTVTQTGAGAKTLGFTNSTYYATINASQTGANTQTATGIDFAAASGTFALVQR